MKAKVALKNLYSLSKYDFHKSDLDIQETIRQLFLNIDELQNYCFKLTERIDELQKKLKIEEVLRYYSAHPEEALNYQEELDYLERSGEIVAFPYEKVKTIGEIDSGYDPECNMAYVVHFGKRLYFPVGWTVDSVKDAYRSYIEDENLLGGSYRKKSPHQYQAKDFKIETGDVLVDIGCAEALLALDTIEKLSKAYLIESDPMWIPALKKTFEPFMEKVVIINKTLTDKKTDTTISLESVLSEERGSSFFLKLDIEGGEVTVLRSSESFLKERQCKVACCTYHNAEDEAQVCSILEGLGYSVSVSDGYVLFLYSDELRAPFFRRGVVRARRG